MAKLASVPIGSQAGDVLRNALPGNDWVSTIVNANTKGTITNKLLFWGHLILNVLTVLLCGFNSFGIGILQKADAACTAVGESCFITGPSTGVLMMVISGGICHVISVVLILLGASIWNREQYKRMVWFNNLLHFFSLFALLQTIFVWTLTFSAPASLAFWLASTGAALHTLCVSMLYTNAAALGVKNHEISFLFNAAIVFDLTVALFYQVGIFASNSGTHAFPGHKSGAWMAFGTQIGAMVTLLVGRLMTGGKMNAKSLRRYPFFRSLVVWMYLISAIFASYKFTISVAYSSWFSYSFGVANMFLSFATLFVALSVGGEAIMYAPMKKSSDENDDTESIDSEDEEEDDEEEIGARIGARKMKIALRR
jgi:hypothetical protein